MIDDSDATVNLNKPFLIKKLMIVENRGRCIDDSDRTLDIKKVGQMLKDTTPRVLE
jgi:hypothetical protein